MTNWGSILSPPSSPPLSSKPYQPPHPSGAPSRAHWVELSMRAARLGLPPPPPLDPAAPAPPSPPPPPPPTLLSSLPGLLFPGLGLLCESYILFSLGLTSLVWRAMDPACYVLFTTCSEPQVRRAAAFTTLGLMAGMLLFGALASFLPFRRRPLVRTLAIVTVALMYVSSLTIVQTPGETSGQRADFVAACLLVFGLAVGGEYPVVSSIAAEKKRGGAFDRKTQVAACIVMQAVGVLLNALVIAAVYKALVGSAGEVTASYDTLDRTWRLTYFKGVLGLGMLLMMRFWKYLGEIKEEGWDRPLSDLRRVTTEDDDEIYVSSWDGGSSCSGSVSSESSRTRRLLYKFGSDDMRTLASTSLSWFFWDFVFYGNKLMQARFIDVISSSTATLADKLNIAIVNSLVALGGTVFGITLIHKEVATLAHLQTYGFISVAAIYAALFLIPQNDWLFRYGYYLAGGLGQVVNVMTFTVPAVSFRREIKPLACGASACAGKLGALVGTMVIGMVDVEGAFLLCAVSCALGAVATWIM
ncbi:hypothetical protein TeGR_g6484 [Tetraparma gracilis]|uniref:Major facilitator superfamily (MFS) profile domain-containing protein n=1 Tax=Tetraparma gracilis TaxID=2962635 RepID=A0ABQ6N6G3_9STRA|nr:hypothetical protein TeGR_g6484 [Tetraparma gracilis]